MRIGLIIIGVGVVASIFGWSELPDETSGGFFTMFLAYPVILIGLVVLVTSIIRRKQ